MRPIHSEIDFDEMTRNTWALAVVAAWNQLGLFAAMMEKAGPVTLDELPADRRALAITAPVLAHLGLLQGGAGEWTLSPVARKLITEGSMAGPRELGWLGEVARITDVLQQGGPVKGPDGTSQVTSGGVHSEDPERTRMFLDWLYRRSEPAAANVADWLLPRVPANGRALDLGGGHGGYGRALAERGYGVTLFDLPLVIELARERHSDVLAYRAGDFYTDDLGGPYDVVLLSNIVHNQSDSGNQSLLKRVYEVLAPGGLVVIKDTFIDDLGREPAAAVFFGLVTLYYTENGASYTLAHVSRWCQNAGFESVQAHALADSALADSTLAFARKPA